MACHLVAEEFPVVAQAVPAPLGEERSAGLVVRCACHSLSFWGQAASAARGTARGSLNLSASRRIVSSGDGADTAEGCSEVFPCALRMAGYPVCPLLGPGRKPECSNSILRSAIPLSVRAISTLRST